MLLLTENGYLIFKNVKLLQNLAFIAFLLNSTSDFIYPLSWPAQPDVFSSVLPSLSVLAYVCLL